MIDHEPEHPPQYRRLPLTERQGASPRRRRHALAASLVAGYLIAAGGAVIAHGVLAMPEWLALHLLVLGAASNAVLVYSRHFAQALLHARPGPEWPANARLAAFNAGALAVLTGMTTRLLWLVTAGAALVVLAVLAHTAALIAMTRAANLSGRLRVVVRYYVAAGFCLIIGGTLGGLLGDGAIRPAEWQQAVRLAHAHLNLLGWLGLVVIGTLFMLWPAVLRTRMPDTAPRTARQVLAVTVTGLAIAVTGAVLTGWRPAAHWLAVAGMVGYSAGVAYALVPAIREMRAKAPRTAAPVALLAGNGWLLTALAIDIAGLAMGSSAADDLLGRLLVPVLGIGTVAQILTGALVFLIPVTVGGGPTGNRRLTEVLEYAWLPRAVLGNLGVLLLVLPAAGALRMLAWALVLAGFGSFPALVIAALRRSANAGLGVGAGRVRLVPGARDRGPGDAAPDGPGRHRRACQAGPAAGWPRTPGRHQRRGRAGGALLGECRSLARTASRRRGADGLVQHAGGSELDRVRRHPGGDHRGPGHGPGADRAQCRPDEPRPETGRPARHRHVGAGPAGNRRLRRRHPGRTGLVHHARPPPSRHDPRHPRHHGPRCLGHRPTARPGHGRHGHERGPATDLAALRPDPATGPRRHRTQPHPARRTDHRRGRTRCAPTGLDL
ncbi:hypothetical protein [Amycolatopsis benzoatilytica]|uniref:hypothetical protein n=1 Tax=Amycolatopsis benzoatilytica TaxID=346045 RepID=UPI00039BAD9F|nr:hypothetical protein [Amycolatopsis benzoatilytica]